MKQLTCEVCGGLDIVKQDGFFVCQSCGCRYTLDEVKKIAIEGGVDVSGSTVKIDSSEKLKNLFQLARRARDDNNIEKAIDYYERIAEEDPDNWEAFFYGVYFNALNSTIDDIGISSESVMNCIKPTFSLMKQQLEESEQEEAYAEVMTRVEAMGTFFVQTALDYYNTHKTIIKITEILGAHVGVVLCMVIELGDRLISDFGDKIRGLLSYKHAIKLMDNAHNIKGVSDDWVSAVYGKIVALEPSYQDVIDNKEIDRSISGLKVQLNSLEQVKKPQISIIIFGIAIVIWGLIFIKSAPLLGVMLCVGGGLFIFAYFGSNKTYKETQEKINKVNTMIDDLNKKRK